MGARKAISAGRILGAMNIILGIVFWLILSQYYFNIANYVANNSPSSSRDYCQKDSDCVLAPQYQGCCPNGCAVEAVNVKEKNMEEEMRNIQCGTKDYKCPQVKCVSSISKQAVCEQNRCVVKEKQNIQTKLQEFEVRQIADAYAKTQGYNLSEYQAPEITYDSKTNEWYLFYDQVYPPRNEMSGTPSKHFSVYIDDTTGEVFRLIPGA